MPEEKLQEKKEENKTKNINPFKDPDCLKWVCVFSCSVLTPILGLAIFWIIFKPPIAIFFTISLLYFVLTIVLLNPLIRSDK